MAPFQRTDIPVSGRFCLARARVPASLLAKPVPGADADARGDVLLDLSIADGRIVALEAPGARQLPALPRIDLRGRQVWPTLVDMHAHLDKGQVLARTGADGSIAGAARRTAADRDNWTAEDLRQRMEFGLRAAYAHGVSAIRTHIDSNHPLAGRVWRVFGEVRDAWAGRISLQGVGLASLDLYLGQEGRARADMITDAGGILGGVTDAIGATLNDLAGIQAKLDHFLALARERGVDVDLHVDQSDALDAFALPHVADAVLRTGFAGRVVCGHCVNLALQPEAVARDAIARCARAGLDFVTLPTPMMYLMDRQSGRTPRWRGVTAVQELQAAGLRVAIGGDNCRDAWFPYGDHDMVDTFCQSVRILQLDAPLAPTPAMAGPIPAAIIGARDHGVIAVGAPARLIIFSARRVDEIVSRPQSDRIVIDRGHVVTQPPPDYAELDRPEDRLPDLLD